MNTPTKISVQHRTQILLNLISKNAIPIRARAYNDDIIKSHLLGRINDPNISDELISMNIVKKPL